MTTAVALDALDLAALLCSRVCHDLISPTGAIVNGLEVLEEKESDQQTKDFALDLIKKSAKAASARLQFCRLAFGAAGSAGAQIDLGDAHNMARGFIEDGKTKLVWQLPPALLPNIGFRLVASGPNSRIPEAIPTLLEGASENGSVDAHAIQPFYAGLLARACGLKVELKADGEAIVISTR